MTVRVTVIKQVDIRRRVIEICGNFVVTRVKLGVLTRRYSAFL